MPRATIAALTPPNRGRALAELSFFILALGAAGCGGAAGSAEGAAVPAPAPARASAADEERGVAVSAEIGGLNEREAEESFRASLDGLQQCVSDGAERVEFMGGSIEFAVEIDASRHVRRVWAAQSSLGERSTEKCMFEALRSVAWPAPQGGELGIARNSFEFEPKKGAPTPAVWDAGRVARVVNGVQRRLGVCGPPGPLLITLYIGEGGKALAGGAASEEPLDESAVDCVVDAFLGARYPKPERAPTKVHFTL